MNEHDRKPKEEGKKGKVIIREDEVQATNVLETTHLETGPFGDNFSRLNVAAVLTHGVRFEDMWKDALENNEGDLNKAIKKFAAAYFSVLSPTTLADIKSKLGTIVKNSAIIFACICSAWKYQNCNQFEDEDGTDISAVLNNVVERTIFAAGEGLVKTCAFNMSNSEWKKNVLKHLKGIYLSKLLAEFIFTYFGHFIDLDPAFEGTQRLYSLIPLSLAELDNASSAFPHAKGANKETFASYLAELAGDIDDSYNAYPFMDGLLEYLGLKAPDWQYNFTRDLAQTKLNIIKDSDELTADMIYMLNSSSNILDVQSESGNDIYNIVKANKFDGSYFTAYDDDKAAADSLRYHDRIVTRINSIVNALRGNIYALNVSIFAVKIPNVASGPRSKEMIMLPPVYQFINDLNVPVSVYEAVGVSNRFLIQCGFPIDGVLMRINGMSPDHPESVIGSYTMTLNYSSGDFVISSDDIESVISDATYYLLFDKSVPAGNSVENTLGNNGSNTTK